MRGLWVVAAGVLAAAGAACAQNAAPVQDDAKTHVAPATASQADAAAKAAAKNQTAPAPQNEPEVLDSVVALVNGDVLLQSDVEQEQRLESLQMEPSGKNTMAEAAQHLVTRTLIVQRMEAQQEDSTAQITDEEVAKTVDGIRKDLPGCAAAHCETADGWAKFLAGRGLTPDEVNTSWRERLAVLNYLNLRFRSGIRIASADVDKYYKEQLVPQFAAKHQAAPPEKQLQARIQELLLQQQVTKQIDDWEQTLRQEGSVQILVPAYGPSSNGDGDEALGGSGL